MTATEKKINVPELRFPDFEGEWEKPKLSAKVEIFRGASPRPKGDKRFYGGDIPRLLIEDVTRDGKYAYPKIDFLTKEGAKKSRFVKRGNVVLSCSGTRVAIPGILGIDACIHDGWLGFRNFNNVDNEFLYYVFVKLHGKMQGEATKGGVFNNLTTSIVKDLKLGFPSLPEQTKIATFLTAVDKRIHLLTRKKEKLEHYKKGVMQKLFSRELRFRGENGNDYPEWEEKRLGEVFEFIGTNSLSRSMLNYEDGTIKNIHYGDIHTKFKSLFDTSKEDVPFINNEVDNSKFSNNQYCKEGDLVIADASEDYKDIGKTIEIINTNNHPLVSGLHTILARPKRKSPLGFHAYLMQSSSVRKQLMRLASGISVLGISKNNLSSVLLQLPCFEEQQKIASFLSAIDKQIEQVVQQIEHSNQWKKGLLQKMFM